VPLPPIVRRHGLSAVTALLFLLAAWRLGVNAELPAVLAFIFGGVLLAVIDWKVQRLPTKIVYLTLAGVSAGLLFAAIVRADWTSLLYALIGAILFAGAYFLIWFLGEHMLGFKLLGLGDVRLAMVLGALLGWYGLKYVLLGALVGHVLALLVGLAKAARERKFHLNFAFGPPLIVATLAVVLVHG
jgi:leader peptidase (prepilin peptidase)/N-methyltransferase